MKAKSHKSSSSYKAISPYSTSSPAILDRLPSELILSICDLLPSADLTCFSLCNHRILDVSQRRIAKLPRTDDDKASILPRLERDFPQYFFCDVCILLHRCDEIENFRLTKRTIRYGYFGPSLKHGGSCKLPCVKNSAWFQPNMIMRTHRTESYSFNRFSLLQLKLAMKRVHGGSSFGIDTDSLSYTQVRRRYALWYIRQSWSRRRNARDILTLFSTEAKVCQPLGLYIRMQDIMIAETMNDLIPDRHGRPHFFDPPQVFEICAHTSDLKDLITSIVESCHGASNSLTCTCEVCDTDAVIEIAPFDSKVALIMTRWVNLGLGLTQNDILWRNHVYSSLGYKRPLPDHLITKPRFCFEDKATESFEELRSRNLSYLRDDRYKTVMSSASYGDRLWFMRDKEQPPKKRVRFKQFLLDRLALG